MCWISDDFPGMAALAKTLDLGENDDGPSLSTSVL